MVCNICVFQHYRIWEETSGFVDIYLSEATDGAFVMSFGR